MKIVVNIGCILLFCLSCNVFAQSFLAKYRVVFVRDTVSADMLEEVMDLQIVGEQSIFRSAVKSLSDSLSKKEIRNALSTAKDGTVVLDITNVPKPKLRQEVVRQKDDVLVYDRIFTDDFYFPLTDKVVWNITNEKEVINSYRCIKAVSHYRGRDYEAWFTEEIPISEGPYIFKGLPGLVVKVYDKKKYYTYELTYFAKKDKLELAKPSSNAAKVNMEQFSQMRKALPETIVQRFEQRLNKLLPEERRKLVRQNALKDNNHIF
ncbi:GLPGLI family protein [Riemerella anatipestifer]|nr:GLPGLI family protein [Riemerella anatipestifer]